jgi:hypothetical protein
MAKFQLLAALALASSALATVSKWNPRNNPSRAPRPIPNQYFVKVSPNVDIKTFATEVQNLAESVGEGPGGFENKVDAELSAVGMLRLTANEPMVDNLRKLESASDVYRLVLAPLLTFFM